jgi:ribosome maturation factor RimP
MVTVSTATPYDGKQIWSGHLMSRNETHVAISIKGRIANIPRELIERVELAKME